jgi:hypothetical protein
MISIRFLIYLIKQIFVLHMNKFECLFNDTREKGFFSILLITQFSLLSVYIYTCKRLVRLFICTFPFRNQVNHIVKYDPDPIHSFDNLHKSNVNIELVK